MAGFGLTRLGFGKHTGAGSQDPAPSKQSRATKSKLCEADCGDPTPRTFQASCHHHPLRYLLSRPPGRASGAAKNLNKSARSRRMVPVPTAAGCLGAPPPRLCALLCPSPLVDLRCRPPGAGPSHDAPEDNGRPQRLEASGQRSAKGGRAQRKPAKMCLARCGLQVSSVCGLGEEGVVGCCLRARHVRTPDSVEQRVRCIGPGHRRRGSHRPSVWRGSARPNPC